MTEKQRIISFLQNHPEGVDDDELAQALGWSTRQRANMVCRALEKEGLVTRRRVSGKIRNFWTGRSDVIASSTPHVQQSDQSSISKSEHWFWEGNIQSKVIQYLAAQGFHISPPLAVHLRPGRRKGGSETRPYSRSMPPVRLVRFRRLRSRPPLRSTAPGLCHVPVCAGNLRTFHPQR